MKRSSWIAIGFLLLLLNAGWLWAFPEPNLFYILNVLLHVGLGWVMFAALFLWGSDTLKAFRRQSRTTFAVLAVCGLLGAVLSFIGAIRPHYWIVVAHGFLGFLGAALLWFYVSRQHPRFTKPL